ncbi:TPA: terminase small subunit [Vibrio cholerae]
MKRASRQLDKLKNCDEYATDRGLTAAEKKFCYEYVRDYCITKASERAGITRQGAHKMLNRERVKDFIEHLNERNHLSSLENEPKMLKGQRLIWANSNMADYFKDGCFVGFENLTRAQSSCIKKIKIKPNEWGTEISIELYDADRSNEILAKPHGVYEPIKIDLSLLDMIDPDDIEKLSKKYGWGEN